MSGQSFRESFASRHTSRASGAPTYGATLDTILLSASELKLNVTNVGAAIGFLASHGLDKDPNRADIVGSDFKKALDNIAASLKVLPRLASDKTETLLADATLMLDAADIDMAALWDDARIVVHCLKRGLSHLYEKDKKTMALVAIPLMKLLLGTDRDDALLERAVKRIAEFVPMHLDECRSALRRTGNKETADKLGPPSDYEKGMDKNASRDDKGSKNNSSNVNSRDWSSI